MEALVVHAVMFIPFYKKQLMYLSCRHGLKNLIIGVSGVA